MYDVIIIGCGISGASIAYQLSKYQIKVAILEKENDVACQTTKANSAIVHAGYDPEPGTLMARFNVEGAAMMEALCTQLSVDYRRLGSLVLGFDDRDTETIHKLYQRGLMNGVQGMQILSGEQASKMEPNIAENVKMALYAPSAAVVDPWGLCIAQAEVAVKNGVDLFRSCEVTGISIQGGVFELQTTAGDFQSRFVVNAAGVHSDAVHELIGTKEFTITPNRGEYYLLDKSEGELVHSVIFPCPTKEGKGVLVSPTVHGNLIVGPSAENIQDGENVATTQNGLESVSSMALKSVPTVNFRKAIRNFAGVRATSTASDFIIGESRSVPHFINVAGICSPGLTSAPAIAVHVTELLQSLGLSQQEKERWDNTRRVVRLKRLSEEERCELIQKNPSYGRIICRCESISEGEILDALRSPITPRTLDAIKRRCGAGMGRCQGGFCGPKVQRIISNELNIPMDQILLDRDGTIVILGEKHAGLLGNHQETAVVGYEMGVRTYA